MKPSVPRLEPPSLSVPVLATVALLPFAALLTPRASAQEPRPAVSRPLLAAAAPAPVAAGATPAPDADPAAAAPPTTETEIVATQGADFDSRAHVASFNGSVHVADPRFELWCDKLTVYLNRPADKKGDAPPAAATPAPAAAGDNKAPADNGGIDRAVADGNVVILQRKAMDKDGKPLSEKGNGAPKISIGRAERAEFKNKTGEMTLTGSPSVQQDVNLHIGAPGTTMILGRDNTLRTFGPSRTVIRQKPEDTPGEKKPKAAATPDPAATPAPPAPGRRRG